MRSREWLLCIWGLWTINDICLYQRGIVVSGELFSFFFFFRARRLVTTNHRRGDVKPRTRGLWLYYTKKIIIGGNIGILLARVCVPVYYLS